MGYSTWNDYGCVYPQGVSAKNITDAADALVDLGLAKLGYQYVNLDDCWAETRDELTHVLTPNRESFPDGMKAVADYIHGKGLKFGIYTDRGTHTCAGRPGSRGHEAVDARTFANWGVDYIKEDSCNVQDDGPDKAIEQFRLMREAINSTEQPVVFAICGWKPWYAPMGRLLANSWRISADVVSWASVWYAVALNEPLASFAGPGGWNDPDMLLGSTPGAQFTLLPEQVQTQFALWAIMSAPLILGARVGSLSQFDLSVYSNEEVIAVNQDPLGAQGHIVWEDCPPRDPMRLAKDMTSEKWPEVPECHQIWAKTLWSGDVALLLVNWARGGHWDWIRAEEALMKTLGFPDGALVRDLYAKQDVGVHRRFEVLVKADSASKLYRLSLPPASSLFA